MFKIILTLVKENQNVADIATIEITETQRKEEVLSPSETVVRKSVEEVPRNTVIPSATKTETTAGEKQVSASIPSQFYTVQVATFSDMRRTENLANRLKVEKFSPVYIKTRGRLFEVCVGNFSNSQDGKETLLKITKDFHDAFIRRIQPPFEEK